jgi:putative flippase GtrA
MKSLLSQALRYGVVGLISALLNYILFVAGIASGLHYLISATISSIATLLISYTLNRNFTFAAQGAPNIAEFISFLAVFATQYVCAMAGYTLLIGYLGLDPSIAFILNAFFVAGIAFTLLRNRTFQSGQRS